MLQFHLLHLSIYLCSKEAHIAHRMPRGGSTIYAALNKHIGYSTSRSTIIVSSKERFRSTKIARNVKFRQLTADLSIHWFIQKRKIILINYQIMKCIIGYHNRPRARVHEKKVDYIIKSLHPQT